jgi:hypothetical protein
VSGALRDGGTAAGGTDSRTGIAPLPAAERAERLPERARQRQGEAGGDALDAMDEMPAGDTVEGEEADPDVLLSVPLKGDVVPEAGTPALTSEGLVVKDGEVEFTDAGMVTFPAGGNFSGDAGTVAFEISPNWAGSDAGDHALVQVAEGIHVWENRFAVVKNVDLLRFFMVDSDGVERNVSVPIRDWEPGQPHRVAASWGDALMSLYVDGQLVGQTTFQGTLVIPDSSPIYVGYNDPANGHAGVGGRLTDLKIYGRAFGEGDLGGP